MNPKKRKKYAMSELNPRIKRGEADSEPTLRDVLAPLFRHRRLMIFSFFGVFLGGVLAALLLTNQYQAHMQILVKRERVEDRKSTRLNSSHLAISYAVFCLR